MAILEFSHKTGKGNIRKRLFYNPTTTYGVKNPSAYGPMVAIKVHKYIYKHPYLAPTLFTDSDGKTYIVPTWQEVHPKTTLKDIEWVRPVTKTKQATEKETWRFESSSEPGHFYVVRKQGDKITCNCSGFWRAKDRRCKHVKEVELKIK
jgi:hypothetical protein